MNPPSGDERIVNYNDAESFVKKTPDEYDDESMAEDDHDSNFPFRPRIEAVLNTGSGRQPKKGDELTRLKREKRLALNRVSARERRRRKKILIEQLETQCFELTKQAKALRDQNSGLQARLLSTERELTRAYAIISKLSSPSVLGTQQQQTQDDRRRAAASLLLTGGAHHHHPQGLTGSITTAINDNGISTLAGRSVLDPTIVHAVAKDAAARLRPLLAVNNHESAAATSSPAMVGRLVTISGDGTDKHHHHLSTGERMAASTTTDPERTRSTTRATVPLAPAPLRGVTVRPSIPLHAGAAAAAATCIAATRGTSTAARTGTPGFLPASSLLPEETNTPVVAPKLQVGGLLAGLGMVGGRHQESPENLLLALGGGCGLSTPRSVLLGREQQGHQGVSLLLEQQGAQRARGSFSPSNVVPGVRAAAASVVAGVSP